MQSNTKLLQSIIGKADEKIKTVCSLISLIEGIDTNDDFLRKKQNIIVYLNDIKDEVSETYQVLNTSLALLQDYEEKIHIAETKSHPSELVTPSKPFSREQRSNFSSIQAYSDDFSKKDIEANDAAIANRYYSEVNEVNFNNKNDQPVSSAQISTINKYENPKGEQIEDYNVYNNIQVPIEIKTERYNTNSVGDTTYSYQVKENTANDIPLETHKAKEFSSKISRISDLIMKIYSSSDFQEILGKLYGDSLINDLTSNDVDDAFLQEIEQTTSEIEKLREKDKIIEKEIEDHFKQMQSGPQFSYSNYDPLNRSQNSFVPKEKQIIEEKEENEVEEDVDNFNAKNNLQLSSNSSFTHSKLSKTCTSLNHKELNKYYSTDEVNNKDNASNHPSNKQFGFMKQTKSGLSKKKIESQQGSTVVKAAFESNIRTFKASHQSPSSYGKVENTKFKSKSPYTSNQNALSSSFLRKSLGSNTVKLKDEPPFKNTVLPQASGLSKLPRYSSQKKSSLERAVPKSAIPKYNRD